MNRWSLRLPPLVVALSLVSAGLVAPQQRPPRVESRIVDLASGSLQEASPGYRRFLSLSKPAEVVGFEWQGHVEGAVEIRLRRGDGWSPWTELYGNPDEGPDPSSMENRATTSAGPTWIGRGVDALDVRVTEGSLAQLKMHLIHSEVSQPRPFTISPATATPAQPGIISRAEWGADESLRTSNSGCGTPEYAGSLRNSFVHHTVNANTYTAEEAPAIVRAIYRYHVLGNGWCDIGYNFLIDRFGRVYEGRFGGTTKPVIGAHSGGFNTGSTGVALIGEHGPVPVPVASRSALRSLLAWKLTHHTVDSRAQIQAVSGGSTRYPAGTNVTLDVISGHRDVSATACPGDRAYPLIPQLRIDVQSEVFSTPPHPLPGWTPAASGPGLLTLDGYGGLHPAGRQAAVTHSSYWAKWPIARAAIGSSSGGYVVDGYGGLHPYGDALPISGNSYWAGWDIVRGAAKGPANGTGYVLDAYGGVHPFGGAALPRGGPYWGWDIARGIAVNASGTAGYVLDGFGGVHPLGVASKVLGVPYFGFDIARAIALRPDGISGYVLDGWGGLHSFGGAPSMSPNYYAPGQDTARGLALTSDGGGGWVLDSIGRIWTFGNAPGLPQSSTWVGLDVARAVITTR